MLPRWEMTNQEPSICSQQSAAALILKNPETRECKVPKTFHTHPVTFWLNSATHKSWKNTPCAELSLEVNLTPVLDPPAVKPWVCWSISPAKKGNSSMEHPNIVEKTEIWLPSNFCGAATSVLLYLDFFFSCSRPQVHLRAQIYKILLLGAI